MIRNFTLLLIGASLLATSCKSVDLLADRKQIIEVCHNQVNAWRTQSYEGEAQAWAHKPYALKMLTTGSRTIGWSEIGKQYKTSFSAAQSSADDFSTVLSDFYIKVSEKGKNAWVVFDQHQIFEDADGEQEIYETLEVRCMEKIDGKWRVVFQLTGPYDRPETVAEINEAMEQKKNKK